MDVRISSQFTNSFTGVSADTVNKTRAAIATVLNLADATNDSPYVKVSSTTYNVTFSVGLSGVASTDWYGDTYGATMPNVLAERFAFVAKLPPTSVTCGYPSRDFDPSTFDGTSRRLLGKFRRLLKVNTAQVTAVQGNRKLLQLANPGATPYPAQSQQPSPPRRSRVSRSRRRFQGRRRRLRSRLQRPPRLRHRHRRPRRRRS